LALQRQPLASNIEAPHFSGMIDIQHLSITLVFKARGSLRTIRNHQLLGLVISQLRKERIDFQIYLLYSKQTLIIVELKQDKLPVESYQ
jgi:hypothetical protein